MDALVLLTTLPGSANTPCLAGSHASPQELELCTPLLHTGVLLGSLCTGIATALHGSILWLLCPHLAPTAPGCATSSWPAQRCLYPQPGPGVGSESQEISEK